MRKLGWLVIFALVGACDDDDDLDDLAGDSDGDGIPNDMDNDDNTPPDDVSEWRATLMPTGANADLAGNAAVRQPMGEQAFSAVVTLRGDLSGTPRPWHVHFGTCETGGGIVGDPAAYLPLRAGEGGTATNTAVIRVGLELEAPYHVNVHESAEALEMIIACGDLVMQ
jgi:Cu-Zn family superoxide dismutase